MMTLHKLTAGDGYLYYLREIASGDALRPGSTPLDAYLAAEGTPPGRWMGAKAAAMGLEGEVTEAQMKALFGEGLHPEAEEIIAQAIAEGATAQQALKAARLGRRFYQFDEDCGPLTARIREATDAAEARAGRPLTDEERAAIRKRIGAEVFLEDFGRAPVDERELERFIRARTSVNRQATSAYDLVFQAPEAFSRDLLKLLVAMGDEEALDKYFAADEQAISEALAWIEENALATRTGANGIAQEDVQNGTLATLFRHFDNRLGEAALHHHLVVSVKVQGLDGQWRHIDGQLLRAMGVAASELYNQRVVELLCQAFGLRAEEREVSPGRRTVMTIAGLDEDLLQLRGRRSKQIRARMSDLVSAYRAAHQREPDTVTLIKLAQRATLQTRRPKKKARSLQSLRQRWRRELRDLLGAQPLESVLSAARAAAGDAGAARAALASADVQDLAAAVVDTVSEYRAVWGRRHLLAEARRHVVRLTGGQADAGDLPDRITAQALGDHCLSITPPDLHRPFAPMARADGTNVFRRREHELYTSPAVLAAEERIVNAAETRVIPALSRRAFARVVQAFDGPPLDAGQRRMAAEFACSEWLVMGGLGPAGSGKTTALRLAAEAVAAGGGRMIALAPSSRAAKVVRDEVGCSGHTLHQWLYAREKALQEGDDVAQEYALGPGDVVVVDEAGMAGSRRIARVVAQAEAAGATVRLVGDPRQLASVESGGILRWLKTLGKVVELETLHRFRTAGEGAASLRLREGDPSMAFDWYMRENRVQGGGYQEMVNAVFAAWQQDTEAGLSALMVADSVDAVADLNERAQAFQLGAGRLDPSREIPLAGGARALVGDVIVTRRNERRLPLLGGRDWVKNGDLWVIEHLFADGSVAVRNTEHRGGVVLPANYVAQSAELGYASTVHRAQGMTVDRCHGLVTALTSRAAAYVAATRGRLSNFLYAVCLDNEELADVLATVAGSERPSRSAHEEIRDAQDRTTGLGQLVAEYAEVYVRAAQHRLQQLVRKALGVAAERVLAADGWSALAHRLSGAEQQGWGPERLTKQAWAQYEEGAGDVGWALADGVTEIVEDGEAAASEPAPYRRLDEQQLDRLLGVASRARARALDDVLRADAAAAALPRAVTVRGERVPAWPDREHGALSRSQLAAAVTAARLRARNCPPEERFTAAEALHALRSEADVRRAMQWVDRAREDYQRTPRSDGELPSRAVARASAAVPVRQSTARRLLRRAEAVQARLHAERQRRSRLPDRDPLRFDDLAALPDWLAPRPVVDSPDTPLGWRQHLLERREVLDTALRVRGAHLAAAPPAWSRPLGAPPVGDDARTEQWERTAALVSMWRVRHSLPAAVEGIGACPRAPREVSAWQALARRIELLRQASPSPHPAADDRVAGRATSAAGSLGDGSVGGRDRALAAWRQALSALQAWAAQVRAILPPEGAAADAAAVAVAAEELAREALRQALDGEKPAAAWLSQVPPPDADDGRLQEHWQRLVETIATVRLTAQITSADPLGEAPSDPAGAAAWEEAQQGLRALQSAHVERRLAHIRALRTGGSPPIARDGRSGEARRAQQHRIANQPTHRRPDSPGGPSPGRR